MALKIPFGCHGNQSFYAIERSGQFFQRTSQRTFQPSLVQTDPVVKEEKMFKELLMMYDGHRVTLNAPMQHVVLR